VPSVVNISFVILEKKIFKRLPTPFLHFCDYLLFEEDLALYLNKLEFPSLIEFVLLVLEKKIF
jgi:hypothetical protein